MPARFNGAQRQVREGNLAEAIKIRFGSQTLEGGTTIETRSSIDGTALGAFENLSASGLQTLIESAEESAADMQNSTPADRSSLLKDLSSAVRSQIDSLAEILTLETAKPISLSKNELKTAAGLFMSGASEALRNRNIIEPMFVPLGSLQRMNMIRRFPRGIVLSTLPATFPLSLAAHQIAAAIAAGAPLILRPSSRAAFSTMRMAETLVDAIGDRNWLAIAPMDYQTFQSALTDDRISMLSFFGGKETALRLRNIASGKHVALHTGGGATAVVSHDADVKYAIECIVKGAFANAGRSGNTIELVLVHERIYPQFRERFATAVDMDAVMGDPLDDKTLCGPLTTENEAASLEKWLSAAQREGGRVVAGGERNGKFIKPAVIEDLPRKFIKENPRALGPICSMLPVSDLADAADIVESIGQDYMVALFSREQAEGLYLHSRLRAGTIIMNEYPLDIEDGVLYRSARIDSGGSYGLRFAVEEMTEPRNLLFNNYWGG